mmetsp:Transcript_4571/g.13738  ORF Transcript_4571/g.13738 Transcript_4571/m.13738 type:complete len:478 (-) Transcript_4571:8941-10374(-)
MYSWGLPISLSRITERHTFRSLRYMQSSTDSLPGFSDHSGFSAVISLAHWGLRSNCGFSTSLQDAFPSPLFLCASTRSSDSCDSGTSKFSRLLSTSEKVVPEAGTNSLKLMPLVICVSSQEKVVWHFSSAATEPTPGSKYSVILPTMAWVNSSNLISTSSDSSAHMNSSRRYLGCTSKKFLKFSKRPSGRLTLRSSISAPCSVPKVWKNDLLFTACLMADSRRSFFASMFCLTTFPSTPVSRSQMQNAKNSASWRSIVISRVAFATPAISFTMASPTTFCSAFVNCSPIGPQKIAPNSRGARFSLNCTVVSSNEVSSWYRSNSSCTLMEPDMSASSRSVMCEANVSNIADGATEPWSASTDAAWLFGVPPPAFGEPPPAFGEPPPAFGEPTDASVFCFLMAACVLPSCFSPKVKNSRSSVLSLRCIFLLSADMLCECLRLPPAWRSFFASVSDDVECRAPSSSPSGAGKSLGSQTSW